MSLQSKLYVIAVVSNPVRYESRYRLFRDFKARMEATPNIQLICVEHAFGRRNHEVTDYKCPWHVQLRGGSEYEIWIKEGMINAGLKRLYEMDPNWEYVAWVDADVSFDNPDWALETMHALQHYAVVQPWSMSYDIGPDNQTVIHQASSFGHDFATGTQRKPWKPYEETYHPGYAWAATRETIDGLGKKLIDWCPLGAGDHHMAHAFIGNIWAAVDPKLGGGYRRRASQFQMLADRYVKHNLGYVDGGLRHYWHGPKRKRYYIERNDILIRNRFDPDWDIAVDHNGVPFLTDGKPQFRDEIRMYMRARDEDSMEL